MTAKLQRLVIAGLAALLPWGAAHAAGPEPAPADPVVAAPAAPGWQFTVMPYVWATGLNGTLRPFTGGPTLSFDRSISDTLEDADGAFFLSFGAERGRLVFLGDFSRVATSRDGLLPGGIPAEGSLKQTTLSLAGGYRVHADQRTAVDVFGGFRAFRIDVDVAAAGGAVSASPTKSFVDPIIGFRVLHALSPQWSAMLYADIGGFGVGSEQAIVAQAMLNWRASDRVTLSGGYRAMRIDYDDGGTLADVNVGGPILGVAFRF